MSADRSHAVLSLLLAGSVSVSGVAAGAEMPDPAFLEYLGMWEASDEEWLLVSEGIERETDAPDDPIEDEESAENVDEQENEE